jgi:hypothetical protein
LALDACLEQNALDNDLAGTPDLYRCQAHFPILPGGSWLSSMEDRRFQ